MRTHWRGVGRGGGCLVVAGGWVRLEWWVRRVWGARRGLEGAAGCGAGRGAAGGAPARPRRRRRVWSVTAPVSPAPRARNTSSLARENAMRAHAVTNPHERAHPSASDVPAPLSCHVPSVLS
ncbi:unnamed protein product [Parnassius apollo]|uniref:(apollo) hypothetical protein n=1 Tax=Parnassius apollo TaxID=110799 RepID=A0A8S3WRH0_PARAO|nr:unnamed protein product [Parnassius apollo]